MEISKKKPAPEWQYAILQGLAEFLALPEAPEKPRLVKRPTLTAYKAAVALISEVPVKDLPPPRIAPDRQGGIQFEWEKGICAVEIGILPNGTYEVLKVAGDEEEEGRAGISRVHETLVWLAHQ